MGEVSFVCGLNAATSPLARAKSPRVRSFAKVLASVLLSASRFEN